MNFSCEDPNFRPDKSISIDIAITSSCDSICCLYFLLSLSRSAEAIIVLFKIIVSMELIVGRINTVSADTNQWCCNG